MDNPEEGSVIDGEEDQPPNQIKTTKTGAALLQAEVVYCFRVRTEPGDHGNLKEARKEYKERKGKLLRVLQKEEAKMVDLPSSL